MTRTARYWIAALATGFALSVQAEAPIFGDAPGDGTGFSLIADNGLSVAGGAVAFVPKSNFDVSSVTLWLSGYTGQFGQSLNVSIWEGYDHTPSAPMLYFGSATPNNGSLAAFAFSKPSANPFEDPSGTTTMSANTEYWLVVTAEAPPGGNPDVATWVGGSASGPAAIDGADNYDLNNGIFSPSSARPAFALNSPNASSPDAVPEPGVMALMTLPLWLWSIRALACVWRASRPVPIAKSPH